MDKKKVKKVLLIGLGSIGKKHARILKQIKPNIEIHRLMRKKSLLPTHPDIDSNIYSLDDALRLSPDMAIISNPSSAHIASATPLAKHGINLLIEKPISNSINELDSFKALIKKTKIKVLVGYNLRFSRSLNFFKEKIQSGYLGRIIFLESSVGQNLKTWRNNHDYEKNVTAHKKLGGGVLLELSHEIDYLNWIFGRIKWVSSFIEKASDLKINVEDSVNSILRFEKNSFNSREFTGYLKMDMYRDYHTRFCRVDGTKSSIMWDGIKNQVKEFSKKEKKWKIIYKDNSSKDSTYIKQLKYFINSIESNSNIFQSIEDSIEDLRIIDSIKRSSIKNLGN